MSWACLLADCLLRRRAATGDAEPVLLAASVVSSQMLRAMAAAAGVTYAETLTGFKWIARAAQGRAERLPVRLRGGAGLRGLR